MKYKINYEMYSNNLVLPKEMVNVDLEKVDGDFLKVALLIFKDTNQTYEVEEISDELNISQKKVKEALVFWNERKLLKIKTNEKQAPTQAQVSVQVPEVNINNNEKVTNIDVLINEKNKTKTKVNVQENRLNEEVVFLLDAIQNMFNHTVSKAYHDVISYVVEKLKLPTDVILLAFHYCNDTMENFNIKYFQKICTTWAEMEINTSEKADKYLVELRKNTPEEVAIKELFNIDRLLLPKEKEYIRIWSKDYRYNMDMIACAGELTYSKTGNYVLAYMNTVLAGWYSNCYTDVSQVRHLLPENKRNAINSSNNISVLPKPNTSYDIQEAENMLSEVPSFI